MCLEVHETRSRTHATEEGKDAPKRQKEEHKEQEGGKERPSKSKKPVEPEAPTKTKKLKGGESEHDGKENATKEFAEFCKVIREHLSVEDMRKILEANGQDASGSEDAVVQSWYSPFGVLSEMLIT